MNKVSRVVMEYAGLVGIPVVGVLGALQAGSWLQAPAAPATGVLRGAAASGGSSLPLLLFSVAVLVACARLAGVAARWIGQPQVVGEMAMGIALGPSLLGWLAPAVSHAVFPPGNHAHLNTLSQLGLLLFMFLVGLEFDLKRLRHLGHTAVLASHASITLPMLLGVVAGVVPLPAALVGGRALPRVRTVHGHGDERDRVPRARAYPARATAAGHAHRHRGHRVRRGRRCHGVVPARRDRRPGARLGTCPPDPLDARGPRCVRCGGRPPAPVRTRRLPGQLQQARGAHPKTRSRSFSRS